jgi:protease-4
VDELGGLDRAVELIKQRAKIGVSEKITLVTYPARRSLFDYLFNREDDAAQLDALIESKAKALVGRLPIHALMHGGILRLMPFTIEVK